MNRLSHVGDIVTLRGTVTSVGKYFVTLHDGTGFTTAYDDIAVNIGKTGEVLQVTARVEEPPSGKRIRLERHSVVGFDPVLSKPIPVSPIDLTLRTDLGGRALAVTGRVRDAFRDEQDPLWIYFILEENGIRAVSAIYDPDLTMPVPDNYIDAVITVVGNIYAPYINGQRYLAGSISSLTPQSISVREPAPANPFVSVPMLHWDPKSIDAAVRAGCRHRTVGRVLATWGGNSFFLLTDSGDRVRIRLNRHEALPAPGSRVAVVGFVRMHPFFVNLVNALCRVVSPASAPDEPVVTKDPHELLFDKAGRTHLDFRSDGKLVRVIGTISDRTQVNGGRTRLTLSNRGDSFEVETDGCLVPEIGSTVEITGICRMIEEEGSDANGIVRFNGFSVSTRTSDDLKVIKRPPWLTPRRAILSISVLLLLFAAGTLWNILLRKLVTRRGRELARESLAHLKAELRVDERTALAVELHDTIAQNLTGVTMQLEGVDTAHRENSPKLGELIGKARHALDSCCVELRNCLWDLRNDAFDSDDISETVRRAIAPHLKDTTANVALDLPRSHISDSTFHALLCIIRELVINAVRHGAATQIDIRGEMTVSALKINVKDNGRGFNPAIRPGPAEGHFGILGIQERLDRLGGTLGINSSPGHGAEFIIAIES